jgi:RHS repeat-associated protein
MVAAALPNGTAARRDYDRDGRLVAVVSSGRGGRVLAAARYRLDQTANPTRVNTDLGTETYRYDDRDRLVEACLALPCGAGDAGRLSYRYDPVGNITSMTRGGERTTFDYDSSDRLVATAGPGGRARYESDDDGNVISAGATRYRYDEAGRIASVAEGGRTASYAYDGAGRRLAERIGGVKRRLEWDKSFAIPQLAQDTGRRGAGHQYFFGAGRIAQRSGRGGRFTDSYLHSDRLGSVTATSDARGRRIARSAYTPYGETRTGPGLDRPGMLGYTGERRTPDGRYHLRARDYDPRTARFAQPDPISASPGEPWRSPYPYAEGHPTVFTDPTGTDIGPIPTPQFADDAAKEVDDAVLDPIGNEADNAWDSTANERAWVGQAAEDSYNFAGEHADKAAMGIGVVGVGACAFATAGICAAVAGPAAGGAFLTGSFGVLHQSGAMGPGETDSGELVEGMAWNVGGLGVGKAFEAARFFHQPVRVVGQETAPALSQTRFGSRIAPQIPKPGAPGYQAYSASVAQPEALAQVVPYLFGLRGDITAGPLGSHGGK